jgi:hypothetical protein
MKTRYFLGLLLITIIVAGVSFTRETLPKDHEMNRFRAGIDRLLPLIDPGSAVNFHTQTGKDVELLLWSRYFLFPTRIDREKDAKRDTTLFVLSADTPDSLVQTFLAGKNRLWSHTDAEYHYLLAADGKQ